MSTSISHEYHGYSPDEGGCYCGGPGCGTEEDYERDHREPSDEEIEAARLTAAYDELAGAAPIVATARGGEYL